MRQPSPHKPSSSSPHKINHHSSLRLFTQVLFHTTCNRPKKNPPKSTHSSLHLLLRAKPTAINHHLQSPYYTSHHLWQSPSIDHHSLLASYLPNLHLFMVFLSPQTGHNNSKVWSPLSVTSNDNNLSALPVATTSPTPVATTSPTPAANSSNSSTARYSRRPSHHPLSFAHNASQEATPKRNWKNVVYKLISCL
jgi:hypothetical protein